MNRMKQFLIDNKKIILCHLVLFICLFAYLVSADFLFDQVLTVNGESVIQNMPVPDQTKDIQSRVEMFQKNRMEWKNVVLLSGWAFVDRQTMRGKTIYLVLQSDSSEFIFDTMPFSRSDVTQYFYNGTIDLTNSGWRANIPESILSEDNYRIGFIIRDNTSHSFEMTNYFINETGFYWK
jgi:hypothetical protein